MRNGRLIVLAALETEARVAAKALGVPLVPCRAPGDATAWIEVHVIGMRAERLPGLLGSLCPTSADRFWMVGFAGALDPSLKVGDVVVDADLSGPVLPVGDSTIRQGRIHTADRLVVSPAQKRALFERTAALAVDMEQRIVRETLAPRGISVTGIRAVGDSADTALDPALLSLVDPIGRPRWGVLAGALLRRPALALSLVRLGRDSSRAAKQLGRALAHLAACGVAGQSL